MGSPVTPGDIMQLGREDPIVGACLMLWRDGQLSWEQTLQLLASELCSTVRRQREMLLEAENAKKIIFTVHDTQTPEDPPCPIEVRSQKDEG